MGDDATTNCGTSGANFLRFCHPSTSYGRHDPAYRYSYFWSMDDLRFPSHLTFRVSSFNKCSKPTALKLEKAKKQLQ